MNSKKSVDPSVYNAAENAYSSFIIENFTVTLPLITGSEVYYSVSQITL